MIASSTITKEISWNYSFFAVKVLQVGFSSRFSQNQEIFFLLLKTLTKLCLEEFQVKMFVLIKRFFFCFLWSELSHIACIGYLAFEAIKVQPFEANKIWQGHSQRWNQVQVVYSKSGYLIIFSADTISVNQQLSQ